MVVCGESVAAPSAELLSGEQEQRQERGQEDVELIRRWVWVLLPLELNFPALRPYLGSIEH